MGPWEHRIIAVESSWEKIYLKQYLSNCEPNSIIGSLARWRQRGIQIELLGNHHIAGRIVAKWFAMFYNYYHVEELKKIDTAPPEC